jgi:hypothetical protein
MANPTIFALQILKWLGQSILLFWLKVFDRKQFQLFQVFVIVHYTIHEFSHMYENGCLLHVFVASYFVLVVVVLKWT